MGQENGTEEPPAARKTKLIRERRQQDEEQKRLQRLLLQIPVERKSARESASGLSSQLTARSGLNAVKSEMLHTESPDALLRVVVGELRILPLGHLLDLLPIAATGAVVLHLRAAIRRPALEHRDRGGLVETVPWPGLHRMGSVWVHEDFADLKSHDIIQVEASAIGHAVEGN